MVTCRRVTRREATQSRLSNHLVKSRRLQRQCCGGQDVSQDESRRNGEIMAFQVYEA